MSSSSSSTAAAAAATKAEMGLSKYAAVRHIVSHNLFGTFYRVMKSLGLIG